MSSAFPSRSPRRSSTPFSRASWEADSNFSGIGGQEPADHVFLHDADHREERPRHSDIGLISRAAGRIVSSAVGMCVCVPITAETRPSRYQPIATFSEVASPCISTKITLMCFGIFASSASATAKWIVGRRHEDASLQIEHRRLFARSCLQHGHAAARIVRRDNSRAAGSASVWRDTA